MKQPLYSVAYIKSFNYFISSETDNFFLPAARLLDRIFRPFLVDILSRKPCLFLRFLFDGWNVLFMTC